MRITKLLPYGLVALAGLGFHGASHAGTIQAELEEPANGLFISGLGKVQGWAFSTVDLERIEFHLDGTYLFDVPGGASRGDVANAHPDNPNAATSGFAAVLNYNILDPGDHTILIRVVDIDGDSLDRQSTLSVDYFTENGLANSVSVDNAEVSGSGNTITIKGLEVDGETFDTSLNWQTGVQGFGYASLTAGDDGGGPIGDCVDLPLPENGSNIVWNVSGIQEGQSVEGTIDTTYTSVSDTQATTQTESNLSAAGFAVTSSTKTVQDYSTQTVNEGGKEIILGYISKIVVTGSGGAGGINVPVDETITFSPDRLLGPFQRFCDGYTWTSPSVEQTIVGSGGTIMADSPVENGQIVSINESVTVPAGTFSTVHRRVSDSDGVVTHGWFDRASGHLVKQESTVDGGTFTEVAASIN